jgi:hypothetical protein
MFTKLYNFRLINENPEKSMIAAFEKLTEEEVNILIQAPVYVSILIAGADNQIDKSEINGAIELVKLKQTKARQALLDYYKEVGKNFEGDLQERIKELPADASKRNPVVIAYLEKVSAILPKLEKEFASQFHASLKEFAKKVAEASGGVLGYMAIGYEESKLIDLHMIKDPVKA